MSNQGQQESLPVQLSLFDIESPGLGHKQRRNKLDKRSITPESDLQTARFWFKVHLESSGHPKNTVYAYTNDLAVLIDTIGNKTLRQINEKDIGAYLSSAHKKSTRKRRLTSLREFYAYLIHNLRLQIDDPTTPFYPERVNLKTPVPLFPEEQKRLLATAGNLGDKYFLMVYLMLKLGLTRTELLALKKQHVDVSDPSEPIIYINYGDPRWRHKDRVLKADKEFSETYIQYRDTIESDTLFPIIPQSVNAILHRIAKIAEIDKQVTPQLLRDTFGVEQAKSGKTEEELLAILGLADDPRNRDSVRRYIRLANPVGEVGDISSDSK